MSKKIGTIINTYELDDEKKSSVTIYSISKMLKEIKSELPKHRKLKIIIETA